MLYLTSVVVLVCRWYYYAADATMFRAALLESGVELNTPLVTIISRIILVALGTLAPLMFLMSEKFVNESGD